jgi:hypothetical protein
MIITENTKTDWMMDLKSNGFSTVAKNMRIYDELNHSILYLLFFLLMTMKGVLNCRV